MEKTQGVFKLAVEADETCAPGIFLVLVFSLPFTSNNELAISDFDLHIILGNARNVKIDSVNGFDLR